MGFTVFGLTTEAKRIYDEKMKEHQFPVLQKKVDQLLEEKLALSKKIINLSLSMSDDKMVIAQLKEQKKQASINHARYEKILHCYKSRLRGELYCSLHTVIYKGTDLRVNLQNPNCDVTTTTKFESQKLSEKQITAIKLLNNRVTELKDQQTIKNTPSTSWWSPFNYFSRTVPEKNIPEQIKLLEDFIEEIRQADVDSKILDCIGIAMSHEILLTQHNKKLAGKLLALFSIDKSYLPQLKYRSLCI